MRSEYSLIATVWSVISQHSTPSFRLTRRKTVQTFMFPRDEIFRETLCFSQYALSVLLSEEFGIKTALAAIASPES
jgi:hypothetical protein